MSRGFYKRITNVTQHTVLLIQILWGPLWPNKIKCRACNNKRAKVCSECQDIICGSCCINEVGPCTQCYATICDSCRVTCECQKTRICHNCIDDTIIQINDDCCHCMRIDCINECVHCDEVRCTHCGSKNNLKSLDCKNE